MSKRRQHQLARRAYADHAAMNSCLASFEQTLAVTSPPAAGPWLRRLRQELNPLIACLSEHRETAEADGGLLTEIEITLGRSHEVSTARRLHRSALERAEDLSSALAAAKPDTERAGFRSGGRRLISAIRRHHELEADLILMAFDQDIGTVD
jgi:hypothetical protein